MQTYSKPALSFEQQIELLKNRGLSISDEERAKKTFVKCKLLQIKCIYASI